MIGYIETSEKLDYIDNAIDGLRYLETKTTDKEYLEIIEDYKQFYISKKLKFLKQIGRI